MRDCDAGSAVVLERLKRRGDFLAVASGLRVAGAAFVLQARRRAKGGAARIGFTVSRQVGNAVERNRVRRRLREIVRASVTAGGRLCPGHDYVLIGRRAALAAPFGEMVSAFDAAIARIHAAERGKCGGGARTKLLHEARRSAQPAAARRNRKQPSQSSTGSTKPPPLER